ncbi:hypothetical protein IFM89_021121 [Coptis chinensis]|uniref:Peroxidase n=1 Tax=Coptis chinensis TaxID=261450 RepID=A0A835H0C6_9MAGN|nr:hypothetical protein IFM89_021121 [Coptis chinensis]
MIAVLPDKYPGCAALVLLNSTSNNKAEKEAIPNLSLAGFDVIDEVKTQLEKTCPGTVSCVDIVALGARDSFQKPMWEVLTGRRDGKISSQSEALANIPSHFSSFSILKQNFSRKGLTIHDLVVLSGDCRLSIEAKIMGLKGNVKEHGRDSSGWDHSSKNWSSLVKQGTKLFEYEVKQVLSKQGTKLSEYEVKQLMVAVDADGNGNINYDEFITAAMHTNITDGQERLYTIFQFQYFDKDNSGGTHDATQPPSPTMHFAPDVINPILKRNQPDTIYTGPMCPKFQDHFF